MTKVEKNEGARRKAQGKRIKYDGRKAGTAGGGEAQVKGWTKDEGRGMKRVEIEK